jgi:tRNA-specific 2-thiouridylase
MLPLADPWAAPAALRGRAVLLAMSGGVDSSTAALLLQERGARVVGLTMKNFCWSEAGAGDSSCCSVGHLQDAERVCRRLGIRHHLLDTSADFGARVLDRFVDEYRAGRTPNPCVDCNRDVRFPHLLQAARTLGCDLVATGHYARLGCDMQGRAYVRRARDAAKDQSYFLHGVDAACLARTVFPLGDMTKQEVRARARAARLPVAEKPDSQEICFLPDGDRVRFLAARQALRPGRLLDLGGRDLGGHPGVGAFTVGQRRGLGVAAGRPLFVQRVDAATGTVVLGDEASLLCGGLEADGFVLRVPAGEPDLAVQVRHRHPPVGIAALHLDGARARIRFAAPERAVAPGQAAVVFAGDAVAGGGRIVAALP